MSFHDFFRVPDVRTAVLVMAVTCLASPLGAQVNPDSAAVPVAGAVAPGDSTLPQIAADQLALDPLPEAGGGLPIFFTIGAGYGQRSDACAQCTSPENLDSFTGHVSLGKYLGYGLGIGLDASAWRRGHPGPQLAPDSTGAPVGTTLSNTLGNASLSLSVQVWHLFVRGGAGLAWGQQDFEGVDGSGDPTVVRASGKGIGYSLGGGVTLPLASMVSLAFFGNWNVGSYDLASPEGILQRGAEHEYLEVGFGLTIR